MSKHMCVLRHDVAHSSDVAHPPCVSQVSQDAVAHTRRTHTRRTHNILSKHMCVFRHAVAHSSYVAHVSRHDVSHVVWCGGVVMCILSLWQVIRGGEVTGKVRNE